jgi:hypothetical protein
MCVSGARKRIDAALQGWSGITAQLHRFGGTEYRLGRREIGHVHGDRVVDIPFPRKVRDELVASGRAEPHHVLPESGWVSIYLRQASDVDRAIELLRLSFEIANQGLRHQQPASPSTFLPEATSFCLHCACQNRKTLI